MIRPLLLLHPTHRGSLVLVERGWWGRLFKPRNYATPAEVRRFNKATAR